MEKLDGVLFRIPELVDYRASFDGQLTIEARTVPSGTETEIARTVRTVYPDLKTVVQTALCLNSDRPMYLGKRHIVQGSTMYQLV